MQRGSLRTASAQLEILEDRLALSLVPDGIYHSEPPPGVEWAPPPPLLADFTTDGILDRLRSGSGGGGWVIEPGLGNGSFGAPISTYVYEGNLAVADFNGDGRLDVCGTTAGTGVGEGWFGVHLGRGDGTFYGYEVISGLESTATGTVDVDADGRMDVVLADVAGSTQFFNVLINDGNWPSLSKTYVGPNGGNWSTAGNWSPSGVPGTSDQVAISGKSVNLSASVTVSDLTLTGGASLTVAANGNRVLRAATLSISSDSTLNLNDNDLVLNYTGVSPIGSWNGSAYSGVTGLIQSGRNGGAWNGNGIMTSMSHVGATVRTLGVGEASAVLGISGGQTSVWNGVIVDATSVLVKYTYTGDIDLNGEINGDDYFHLDSHVFQSGAVFGYGNGDIDLDGELNSDDYFWIDSNILAAQALGAI